MEFIGKSQRFTEAVTECRVICVQSARKASTVLTVTRRANVSTTPTVIWSRANVTVAPAG